MEHTYYSGIVFECMKDCPRCGSALSHYALAEGEAYGCDACGWVGVDVEHRSKPAKLESWHDAISRFEAKFANDGHENAVRNLDRVRDNVPAPDDEPEGDPKPNIDRVPATEPAVPTDDDGAPATEEPGAADADPATEAEPQALDADGPETDESEPVEPEVTEDEPVEPEVGSGDSEPTDQDATGETETGIEDTPETTGDDDQDPDGVEEDAPTEVA
jgi:hypothetical protein